MKSIRNISLIIVFLGVMTTGCYSDLIFIEGYGDIVTEYLDVEDFHGIEMDGVDNVVISYGEELEVMVVGHENIIPRIMTNVNDGVWNIRLERGNYRNYDLTYYITMPSLSQISNDGVARVEVEDFQNDDNLVIDIDGAGKVILNRMENTQEIVVNIDGTGIVRFNDDMPDLEELDIYITGAGDFKGFNAITSNCTVDIVGTGLCEVNVEDQLQVFIDGAGTVRYQGNPYISQEISGVGCVVDWN